MKDLTKETQKAILSTTFPHNVNMFTKQVRKELEDNELIVSNGWDVILTEKEKNVLDR